MFKSNLKILRLIGFLEGISFLLLLGVGMPLKYIWEDETIMMPLGMVHGALFIGYIIWILIVAGQYKQKFKFVFLNGLASIVPFGTFVADSKLLKPLSS